MKKSYATPFAIAGASMTAVLLAVLNLITTPGVLWCIYPIYALAWWPIGVALCRKGKYMAFSIAGSLLTIALVAAVNIITSPQTLWFLYAIPLLLCWPLAMHFRQNLIRLSIAGLISAFVILYFLAVNLLITPGHFWAIYPIFGVLWWPISLYYKGRKDYMGFSIAGAILTISFFVVSNLTTASYPWALYACFPVLWWPLAVFFGKKLGGFKFSVLCSACVAAYYCALNVLLAPGSPWVIFVVFALLWWPLSVYFYGKRLPHVYAAIMTAISIAFFVAVNAIYSPGAIWAFYPAFALLWWPMTLLFAREHAWLGYSVAASILFIAFFSAVNILTSHTYPWSLFPSLAILWWPLSVFFKGRHKPFGFSVAGSVLLIGTLAIINLMTSHGFLWFVFPSLAILWWPVGVLFAQKKSALGLSFVGSILIIGLLAAINLMTSPTFLWFIFPALAVLFWPAAIVSAKKRSPFGFSIVGSLLALALLASINLITSPAFLWFLFPAFVILWWPLALYFFSYRKHRMAN